MNIGIFGGSFNPIHVGHAILANYITQFTDIDQVWLMVSPQNPLKSGYSKAMDYHRIRMTELVAKRNPNINTSAFEFTLPKPSYTINTLNALCQKFPQHNFKLIIGADNWDIIEKWKDYKEIIEKYGVIVYPRKGYENLDLKGYTNVTFIDAPLIEISSTFIRNAIKDGKDMSFLLPDEVYYYIKENSLYI